MRIIRINIGYNGSLQWNERLQVQQEERTFGTTVDASAVLLNVDRVFVDLPPKSREPG
jgi:hypothetical protein